MTVRPTIDFRLYLISDSSLFEEHRLFLQGLEAALRGGVMAVQLREKDLATRPLLDLAYRVREITGRYGARLFINDRADIALAVAAEGVHLGQSSMPASAVRKLVGEHVLIGVSTHSLAEARTAEQEGVDFITLGPVYQTPSKAKYGRPIGLEDLRVACGTLKVPVFGIGGMKEDNLRPVLAAGARGIALISGILSAGDIEKATRDYLTAIGERHD